MIEVKASMKEKTTAISAAGTLSTILTEYAMITGALFEQLLSPCNRESEYEQIKALFVGAMLAGVNKGLENHKKEVKKSESVED